MNKLHIVFHLKNKENIMSINGENWKQIDNTRYYVSDKGRVKNVDKGTFLSPFLCKGYYYVHLGRVRKERVHRLVAIAFIPFKTSGACVAAPDWYPINANANPLIPPTIA